MKRYGYLYEKIYEKENIRDAIFKSSKGKRQRGDVKFVLENIDVFVDKIHLMLLNKTYIPSDYTVGTITEGANKKERKIFKPKFFPDQIIHWALILQIQPIFKNSMYQFVCGSIPNKGVHYAKRYVEGWIKHDIKNTKYYLKLDISKFYPSVNNDILLNKIKRKIKDDDVINLIASILSKANGLPIGILLSQWFANFYLSDLDFKIKHDFKIKYYVRYMDDMILFGSNKRKLHKTRLLIQYCLNSEALKLKPNYQVYLLNKEPLDFVGFKFSRGYTRLRRTIMLRITRKVKRVWKKTIITHHDAASIMSYLGWIKHSNSYNLYQKWINPYIDIKKLKCILKRKDILNAIS